MLSKTLVTINDNIKEVKSVRLWPPTRELYSYIYVSITHYLILTILSNSFKI